MLFSKLYIESLFMETFSAFSAFFLKNIAEFKSSNFNLILSFHRPIRPVHHRVLRQRDPSPDGRRNC